MFALSCGDTDVFTCSNDEAGRMYKVKVKKLQLLVSYFYIKKD